MNKYALDDEFFPWDDEEGDKLREKKVNSKYEKNMKKIFIEGNIKKEKFTKANIEKLKLVNFTNVNKLMNFNDGNEGYLGAYSEVEFYAYSFRKIHGIYPDLLRILNIKGEKFLSQLFQHADIPLGSYYKSYTDDRGKMSLNSVLISINNDQPGGNLYIYVEDDEASLIYNKELNQKEDSDLVFFGGLLKGVTEPIVTKNKIYVVYQTQSGFEKTGFDVKKINIDLSQNYNDGFEDISKEIITGLNDKNKTNLVILSGDPGTGKTTYIRYLTSKIKKNIIFIAPDMVNHITDPSFIPFLIKNNDAVLIIEDAEPALQSRDGNGRTGAVSNVLNLTDGLLSDCLNISIVATFNTTGKNIDSALLRKGRLLKNYKFDKLSIEKSKSLLKKLGRGDIPVSEPMTLAEIYYYGEDNNSNEFNTRKIGFKTITI